VSSLHPIILSVPPVSGKLDAQRRVARQALALSCKTSGVPCGPFEKDVRDVPQPFDGIYWSLTHKPRYVAAVVARTPVGIDLEEIRPRDTALYGYVADEREWALAGDRNWDAFFRFWTAKEAVLKATGAGLKEMKKARIQAVIHEGSLTVQYAARTWTVQHYRFNNYLVSLTHEGDIRWTLVDDHPALLSDSSPL
jgi:4'-phosphopantetheinyl transferase